MKVSYNWLREYVSFSADPAALADKLTMAGLEVKGIEQKDGDPVYEIEITSNRPDWLCLYGIAHEIQALYGLKMKPIKSVLSKSAKLPGPSIKIEDKKGCLRYVGIVIDGVKVGVSGKDLAHKVESAGMRQVNNVADITNYCMMESGQPLHAFDYDKLEGGRIIVRRARKGEELVTIDGIKRALDEDILVIADAGKPVAIAGIMGGRDTEVSFSTKKVLLESAYFDPVLIRRGARKLGLSSEASYRFERNVDLGGCLNAAKRAVSLICGMAGAGSVSKVSDVGSKGPKDVKIRLSISKANKILGTKIPAQKCASILKGLGLGVKPSGRDTLLVSAPSFRRDLKAEIDLVEEIARIYGYDKIPGTLPRIQLWGKGGQKSRDRIVEEAAREVLVGAGLNEVITYSLRCKDPYVQKALNIPDENVLKVQNPLSSESETLRSVLVCGMLDVVSHNLNRKVADINVFELGKSYSCEGDGTPCESGVLAIALCGLKKKDWRRKEAVDIFDIKGIIEVLFDKLGIRDYSFEVKPLPLLSPAASAVVKIGTDRIGTVGRVDKALLDKFDIKNSVFVGELDLAPIYEAAKLERKFAEMPRFPSSARDISLIVEDKVSNADIVNTIKDTCGALAISVVPFDLYRGEQVPKGCKSILYSVEYRAPDRTLTDAEVNSLDGKVREVLVRKFEAKLR
ncbi:MAG: phenylalanine--tRNA ligase subunit beta [Candidatus Omnitrophota bacterium]